MNDLVPYSDIRRSLERFKLNKKLLQLPELEPLTEQQCQFISFRIKDHNDGKLQLKAYLLALRDDGNDEARQLFQEILGAI